jgi:hypothetical protein
MTTREALCFIAKIEKKITLQRPASGEKKLSFKKEREAISSQK